MTTKPYILFRYSGKEDRRILKSMEELAHQITPNTANQKTNVPPPEWDFTYIIVTLDYGRYMIALSTFETEYMDEDVREGIPEEDMNEESILDKMFEILVLLADDISSE